MAFTAAKVAGDELTASHLATRFSEVTPIAVRKSLDETVNNSTTLQNDDELFLSLAASTTYDVELQLFYNTSGVADLKFAWTLPSGATFTFGGIFLNTAGAIFMDNLTGSIVAIGGTGGGAFALVKGNILTTNAGTLQLQWAQNTLEVSNSKVLAGSILKAKQLL